MPKQNGKLLNQPFNLLLLLAISLLVLPLLFWGQGVSIQIHRIMIFLTDKYYCRALALFLALCWIVYFYFRKILVSRYLTNVHVVITVTLICWLMLNTKWVSPPSAEEVNTRIFRILLDGHLKEINLASWKTMCFVAAQLCFILNVILGLIRRYKKAAYNSRFVASVADEQIPS